MKNRVVYIILTGIVVGFSSCKSQDSIYEEYLVPNGLFYPGQAMNAVAKPGDGRIELTWQKGSDPKVVKASIFWNNYTRSVDVDISPDMDIVSHIIDPIAENMYSFMIHTYDADGNTSIPVEVMGRVYGNLYRSTLTNRVLKNTVYDGLDMTLNWAESGVGETGINLNYTDIHDNEQSGEVFPSETTTVLNDYNPAKPLVYFTSYKPDSLAIDVFHAPTIEILIDTEK